MAESRLCVAAEVRARYCRPATQRSAPLAKSATVLTAVDASGSAYVTGYTFSSGFPATAGAFDTTHNGGADAYVAKLDSAGALIYVTYLGGSSDEFGNGIAVDAVGNAYVTGDRVREPGTRGIELGDVSVEGAGHDRRVVGAGGGREVR